MAHQHLVVGNDRVLVLAMVGVGFGIVVDLVKLVRDLALISETRPEWIHP